MVAEPTHPSSEQRASERVVARVEVTYYYEVDVTDMLETPSYRGPTGEELNYAAKLRLEAAEYEIGDQIECVGFKIAPKGRRL